MIDSKQFIANCTSLKKQLEPFKSSLFNNNIDYSESLNELSNSIDYINAQYDESNDMQTNQELVVKFADRYFKGITKLLNTCKKIVNAGNYQLKDEFEIQFKDPVLKLINIIHDYADLLKSFTDNIQESLNNAQLEINKQKNEYLYGNNDINNTSPAIQPTSYLSLPLLQQEQPKTTISPIISNSTNNKPDYSLFESYNRKILLLEDDIQTQIVQLFIYLGGLIGEGIAKVGDGVVELLNLLDSGWNNFNKIILPKMQGENGGLLTMLNDPECQKVLSSGIMWGVVILGIIWLARYILRKVTAILAWLSGYDNNYRRRRR